VLLQTNKSAMFGNTKHVRHSLSENTQDVM